MGNAVIIIIGVLCGILSGAPYIVALAIARRRRSASMAPALIAVAVSVVAIALSVVLGLTMFRESLLALAFSVALAFLGTVVAGVIVMSRNRRP